MAPDSSPRLDRRAQGAESQRGKALHLLGLYRGLLAARPRLPPRPLALLARSGRPPSRRGRRQMGAGAGESVGPCADVDRLKLGLLSRRGLWRRNREMLEQHVFPTTAVPF